MESLVTLLVFSIGMLGLGQLQARLWVNSGDIHSANLALLIAENVTELIEINTLILPTILLKEFNCCSGQFSIGNVCSSDIIGTPNI